MSDTPPASPVPPAAPAKSGNRAVIIIVCIVVGFVLLVGGCVSTCVYLAAKKAREISREARKNPVYASLSLAASLNPDVQVVSKDEATGKITVRKKKTGEIVTINSNDFTTETVGKALEKLSQDARAAANVTDSSVAANPAPAPAPEITAGKATAMAAIVGKFPAFVPAYPGGTTLEASQNTAGSTTVDNYAFLTSDKLDTVVAFYEKKAVSAGFTAIGRNGDTNDFGPTTTLNLMRSTPPGTMTVSAESKEGGKVQVSISVTEVGK